MTRDVYLWRVAYYMWRVQHVTYYIKCLTKVTDEALSDLQTRLNITRIPDSLQGEVNFEYGFHSVYMKEVLKYWLNKYNWRTQEKLLNSYPQYMTNIEGIDVHFIHIKPSKPAGKLTSLFWHTLISIFYFISN